MDRNVGAEARLSQSDREELAILALARSEPISDLAVQHGVSRKFVYGAPGGWRDPAGGSPARVRGSARLVVSVASWKVTTTAKRTQQSCGVWG